MVKLLKEKGVLYILGLVVFFSLIHYKGFDKDAAIYLLQVMNYLQPERFVNDVPFMFGNQDTFSIYSPIIAAVFKVLGVNGGGMAATFFLLSVLCVSTCALVSKWNDLFGLHNWDVLVVLTMFVLLIGKTYGSGSLHIPFFEPYLVARVFSEIFVIVGLFFLFNTNKYISLVFFIVSILFHPLMGGWSLLLWLFYHFSWFRIPALFFALILPLSGFLHIAGFDFFPEDWKPLYLKPCLDEFVIYVGLLFFWLAMYENFKESTVAKFSISIFWVSLIGFYLQFAGSYMEHVFLYQVQPFRVQWLSTMSLFPIYAFFVYDCLSRGKTFTLRDAACIVLGLLVISGTQWADVYCGFYYFWLVLLVISLFCVYSPVGYVEISSLSHSWSKALFVFSLIIFVVDSLVCNYVQLAIEQGVGNVGLAIIWSSSLGYLEMVRMFLLFFVLFVCLTQKQFLLTFLFAMAFCNTSIKILPIVGLLFCVMPDLRCLVKRMLLAFAVSISFFELSNSLYRFNSTEKLPLEGNSLVSVLFFFVLFGVFSWLLMLKEKKIARKNLFPLVVLIVTFFVWDVYRWDSRNDMIVFNERQMDAFFEQPIFPQVRDRGKLLFVVDNEAPTQSRINFMTGAYADESIYVGEIFFREQYLESNRRRNALLTGSSEIGDLYDFKNKIMNIYQNSDTLLARVDYLCINEEITHLATDLAQMPFSKQDSIYLDKRNKYVYLYGCKK